MTTQQKEMNKSKVLRYFLINLGLVSICLIVIISVGFVITKYSNSLDRVIAIVDGVKIYQRDLNKAEYGLAFGGTIEDPEEVPDSIKDQLYKRLIEFKVLEKKAKELEINLTENEISAEATNINPEYSKFSGEQKEIIVNNARASLLRRKVQEKVITWSEGKFVLVRHDLHYYDTPTGLSDDARTAAVPKDKEAAATLVNNIYDQITSGKMTFEQGMEMANADKTLGVSAWQPFTMIWSQQFTKEDSVSRGYPVSAPEFWDKVNSVEIGEVSKPMAVKVKLNGDTIVGKKGESIDGMFLIVSRDKGVNGEANSYDEWLSNAEKNLKVKKFSYN